MPRTRRVFLTLVASLATCSTALAAQSGSQASDPIRIPDEVYTLPNGLTVILAVDHATPQVAVDVWYHVGSKNEQPGHTGFAHMFEHVMFTGSGHVPYGMHDRYTEGVGGYNNGSTSNDRTNYYEMEPSNYLETALWLESDRMGFLLDKLDDAKFVAQREIVQNERRERTDNQPYGRAGEIMTAAMYPPSNPYSWPIVGYMADLQQATVDDVKAFFRLYYAPSNATLAIVGDFDPAQAKAWVKKYFGDLPKGAPITRPNPVEPTLSAERRLVYEDQVQVPRLYLRWPSVDVRSDDYYALNLLGSILTGSRTARLTKALVYDSQSAANVFAGQSSNEAAGEFGITITPRPGHTLLQLERATDSILDRFKREGPTDDEMAKAKAGLEYGFVRGLESDLGKAETLLSGLVFHGDAGYFKTQYTRMRAVTAADVQRVANRYLGQGRVVLSVVPIGRLDDASMASNSTRVTVSPDGGHYLMGGN
jgi:zinc protease